MLNDRGIFRNLDATIKLVCRKKKKLCGFSVSESVQRNILAHSRISPSKLLTFLDHFLSSHWDHMTVVGRGEQLGISAEHPLTGDSFVAKCVKSGWVNRSKLVGQEKKWK